MQGLVIGEDVIVAFLASLIVKPDKMTAPFTLILPDTFLIIFLSLFLEVLLIKSLIVFLIMFPGSLPAIMIQPSCQKIPAHRHP